MSSSRSPSPAQPGLWLSGTVAGFWPRLFCWSFRPCRFSTLSPLTFRIATKPSAAQPILTSTSATPAPSLVSSSSPLSAISTRQELLVRLFQRGPGGYGRLRHPLHAALHRRGPYPGHATDRKSTRLNSSHL